MGPGPQLSNTAMLGQQVETSQHTQVIWGTNISANETQSKLKTFINTFVELNDDDADDQQYMSRPYYFEKLKELKELEETVLEIDCNHIWQYDQQLYKQLEDFPCDIIPLFDLVATSVYREMYLYTDIGMGGGNANTNHATTFGGDLTAPMAGDDHDQQMDVMIQVRPFNLKKTYRIRELDPTHIEKLITLKGIVIRCSDVIPEMKEAAFTCVKCQREERRFIEKGKIIEPTLCEGCQSANTFKLDHSLCLFSDKQHVKVQETPESVPEGETPQTIHLCAYEDFVDEVRPGDRVEITGIYRAMGVRVNPNRRTLKNIYRTYIDVICYQKTDKARVNVKDADAERQEEAMTENVHMEDVTRDKQVADQGLHGDHQMFSDAEIKRFKEFSQQ